MQADRSAAFCFKKAGVVLHGLVPEPPPKGVALHIAIMAPESGDYNTIAGATVQFRFDQERDRVAEYREADPVELGGADLTEVHVHAPMTAETAKLLHDGKLANADVVLAVLGVGTPANTSAQASNDKGLHGLSDAPGG